MPRRLKKSTGGWMTPVSSCMTGQPGPHPPAPPALPTSSVNPFLPTTSVGGMAPAPIPSSMPSPPPMNTNRPLYLLIRVRIIIQDSRLRAVY